jgi:hypothetical protein
MKIHSLLDGASPSNSESLSHIYTLPTFHHHHHPKPHSLGHSSPAMEASASSYASAPAALLPLLAAPPRFLHLPLRRPSGRRHGFAIWGGGGLLLQPPLLGPGSRARCRTTCCASSPEQEEVLLGGASLVSLAAVALLSALQLIWLRWRSARHWDFPEVSL